MNKTPITGVVKVSCGIPFYFYPYIGKYMILCTTCPILSMFFSALLTMEWYMMSRLKKCVFSHVKHIDWRDNHLIICFLQSKTNQQGLDKNIPWNLRSTTKKPVFKTLKAISMYILLYLQNLMGNMKFFPGSYNYKRYINAISEIIKYYEVTLPQAKNLKTQSCSW